MQPSQVLPQQKPVYLLASSEPLLVRDWLDGARSWLREHGYEDIVNLQVEAGFAWGELLEDSSMMSLFASQRSRIVHLPTGKPGQQGGKTIQTLCESPADDCLYIFVTPALDRQAKNASWCKSIQRHGVIIELKPVYDNQLVDWIVQRASSKQLGIDMVSAQFLAECTEGNLLAADQELEKLLIRFGTSQVIDFETVEASVVQSSRYNHFLLVDACLAGELPRALKILKSLAREGYATPQLRWGMQNTLEQLAQLKQAETQGTLGERSWQALRIWRSRQRLYQRALSRLKMTRIERLLQSCAKLDRLGKGWQDSAFPNQDWIELKSIVAQFCR